MEIGGEQLATNICWASQRRCISPVSKLLILGKRFWLGGWTTHLNHMRRSQVLDELKSLWCDYATTYLWILPPYPINSTSFYTYNIFFSFHRSHIICAVNYCWFLRSFPTYPCEKMPRTDQFPIAPGMLASLLSWICTWDAWACVSIFTFGMSFFYHILLQQVVHGVTGIPLVWGPQFT